MPNLLVLGTQWGDEGKGKIVDLLTPAFDIVARYQGGHNAGHTVYVDGRKIVLHLIPSGILHPGKLCAIGSGVVVSPEAFFREIDDLAARGIVVDGRRLAVSRKAHIIMPYHPILERIGEDSRGERKIGTTCRGIGPAYEDKAGRWGIRVGDLLEPAVLEVKVRENLAVKNALFRAHGLPDLDAAAVFEEAAAFGRKLAPFVQDVSDLLEDAFQAGRTALFEGAQGTLLDIDHGTFPYVTSSNSTAGGAASGLGIGPRRIDGVLGITKAYTTRVGGGPFPTELRDERGRAIGARGDEFGATTGRPRRCGWFDAVAVRYACRINGVDRIALTKPDVLEALEEVSVCTGYRYKGDRLKSFPTEPWILDAVVPEYRTFPGWRGVHRARRADVLPAAFRDYVAALEDMIETRVGLISTGVERAETVILGDELRALVDPAGLAALSA